MTHVLAFDLVERAQYALTNSPIYGLRDLRVEQDGDLLLISGRVNSYYLKQLAQEAVRAVVDGMQLSNTIDVC